MSEPIEALIGELERSLVGLRPDAFIEVHAPHLRRLMRRVERPLQRRQNGRGKGMR